MTSDNRHGELSPVRRVSIWFTSAIPFYCPLEMSLFVFRFLTCYANVARLYPGGQHLFSASADPGTTEWGHGDEPKMGKFKHDGRGEARRILTTAPDGLEISAFNGFTSSANISWRLRVVPSRPLSCRRRAEHQTYRDLTFPASSRRHQPVATSVVHHQTVRSPKESRKTRCRASGDRKSPHFADGNPVVAPSLSGPASQSTFSNHAREANPLRTGSLFAKEDVGAARVANTAVTGEVDGLLVGSRLWLESQAASFATLTRPSTERPAAMIDACRPVS